MDLPKLLRPTEVARMLGVSTQTLANWRHLGIGLPYVRIGRTIRYSVKDIEAYIASRTIERKDG